MKAVLYGSYPARELERLRRFVTTPWRLVPVMDDDPAERKARELADADALVTSRYGAGDPAAPKLRLLQSSSTGTDGIDPARLPPGCVVCNLFGHEIAMAEYVICSILDWAIGFRRIAETLADGTWTFDDWIDAPMHGEAFAKVLGIVGFGAVGRAVAARAKALGMRINALSAWRRNRPDPGLVDRAFGGSDTAAFLAEADYVVVCCPLNAQTRGMVDQAWFAKMRPNAVLIHVGRGPVVDEASLYAALARKTIRGASIDVWYRYPEAPGERVAPSRFAFHDLPNVVMTPHRSGRSDEAWDRRFQQVGRNLDHLAAGRPLENVVDRS